MVTTVDLTTTKPARRGPERREAICDAVFELLAEVGYDRMTMDAVAARAHASKATIYRGWPDKPELVAEALVQRFKSTPEPADTGSLRGDLLALMTFACEVTNSADGEVISGVMTAATRNPALSRIMHQCIYEAKSAIHEMIVQRAVARDELPADTDPALLHEVMHAMILTASFWTDVPRDDVYSRHVVDDVLIPVLLYRKTV